MKKHSIESFIKNKHEKEQAIDNFINWFGNSVAVDEWGTPVMLYHGTTHDISKFDSSFHWKESFVGDGFYFTNTIEDASENYASLNGPDIKGKIDQRNDELSDCTDEFYAELLEIDIEDIENMEEDELSEKIQNQVLKELAGDNLGNVIPVYLRMENPLILDSNEGTDFNWNVEIDGNATDLEKILEDACEKHSDLENIDYIDPHIIYQEIKEEILVTNINDVDDILNYLEDDNYDFQSFKNENEEEFKIFFDDLKEIIIEHYGNKYMTIELEEGFSGELYDFLEHLKEHIDTKCSLPSNESSDSMIFKIHEQIGLETFCDYSINVQKLKKFIEEIEEFSYMDYSDTGEIFQLSKVLNEFARKNDYDGIIMNPMETHFSNMKNIDDFTRHYIVFDSNQVKSAIGNSGDYSLEHDEICYRLKPKFKKTTPINKKRLEKITNDFESHFNIQIKTEENDNNFIKGYAKSGVVYVNKNNIDNEEDLVKTLNHETFHVGFKERFGKSGKIYLDKAFKLFDKNNDLDDIRKKYNLDFSKPSERLKAAEEKIAEIAENGGKVPFFNNLKGMIKHNIRDLEEKIEKDIEFNYQDIEKVVIESFKHLSTEKFKQQRHKRQKPS